MPSKGAILDISLLKKRKKEKKKRAKVVHAENIFIMSNILVAFTFEPIVQTNNAICGVTAESKTDKNDSEEIKNNNFKKNKKKEQ